MALTTQSKVNQRVYQRAFDHEEAQRLHASGVGYREIADRFGVSEAGVRRVCDPKTRARMDKHTRRWMRENLRSPCRGGCGRLVWTQTKDRSGYCRACEAAQRTAPDERDGELRCTRCREWKPDDEFRREKDRRTRRGHYSQCRSCEAATRREHRKRHPDIERRYQRANKRKGLPMRTFTVLRKNGDGWEEVSSEVEATTRLHAVENAADGPGTYAALLQGDIMPVEETTAFKVTNTGPGRKAA